MQVKLNLFLNEYHNMNIQLLQILHLQIYVTARTKNVLNFLLTEDTRFKIQYTMHQSLLIYFNLKNQEKSKK